MDIEKIKQINPSIIKEDGTQQSFQEQLLDVITGDFDFTKPMVVSSSTNINYVDRVKQEEALLLNVSVLIKCKETHGLSYRFIKNIDKHIQESVLAFDSPSRTDSIVVVLEAKEDENSKPVIVAIQLDKNSAGEIEINDIRSAYSRNNFENYLKQAFENENRFYKNEKTRQFFHSYVGSQCPKELIDALQNDDIKTFTKSQLEKREPSYIVRPLTKGNLFGVYAPDGNNRAEILFTGTEEICDEWIKDRQTKKETYMFDKIGTWYRKVFPADDLGAEIRPSATFFDVYHYCQNNALGNSVYDILGVRDSIVRERVFLEIAEIKKMPYEELYDAWRKAEECKRLPLSQDEKELLDKYIETTDATYRFNEQTKTHELSFPYDDSLKFFSGVELAKYIKEYFVEELKTDLWVEKWYLADHEISPLGKLFSFMDKELKKVAEEYPELCQTPVVYYLNGNDSTAFDWATNSRLCEFVVFVGNDDQESFLVKGLVDRDGTVDVYCFGEGAHPTSTRKKLPDWINLGDAVRVLSDAEENFEIGANTKDWDLPLEDTINKVAEKIGVAMKLEGTKRV